MASQQQGEKVAVLGGGPAAIAAAYELSEPGLKGRYDVTVYQPGWRLGGKCASGRNAAHGGRIEEHGLHIWFGFYDNAFGLMRSAYAALNRPEGHPLRTFEDAFKACNEIVLYDRQVEGPQNEVRWVPLPLVAPTNSLEPGEQGPLPGFWDIARWLCEWAIKNLPNLSGAGAGASRGGTAPARAAAGLTAVTGTLEGAGVAAPPGTSPLVRPLHLALQLAVEAQARGTQRLPRGPLRAAAGPAAEQHLGLKQPLEDCFAALLRGFRDVLWGVIAGPCESDPHVRLFFTMFDTFVSAAAGVIEDGVLENGWQAINDQDLCEWLQHHGAKPVTLGATPAERSPLLRSIYDVAFGYPEGNIAKANIAAGTAMNDFLRLAFSYRESLMFKMQAGMGDTVLTPFYEVLKARGVKFKFFHAVKALHLSGDGATVDGIDVVEQIDLAAQDYDPITIVQGLECWPSEPLWKRLPEGVRLTAERPNFEGEADPCRRGATKLTRQNGDFEHVVLGIPVGALGAICTEVAAHHPPFKQMLATAVTVPTQAFQLWLTKTPQALGWAFPQNSVAGCFVEPLDTWCDMSHLIEREEWAPGDSVNGIAYFCGVLQATDGESEQDAAARVKQNAERFLMENIGQIWPGAAASAGGFEWDLLAGAAAAQPGPERLQSQYWRANVSPSEQYVLTPSGTVQSRLGAGESGVSNLYLAGDWTRNGIDGGCVEAAMTSGIQAALALIGSTGPPIGSTRPLSGVDPRWLSAETTRPVSQAAAAQTQPAPEPGASPPTASPHDPSGAP